MPVTITQLFLSLFLLFAISRVYLRFKGGHVSLIGFLFWMFIFGSAIATVLFPTLSGKLASFVGVGRGVDAVIYTSIVLLFYLVFRLYVYLEDIKHEITDLVREIALKSKDAKKSSQN